MALDLFLKPYKPKSRSRSAALAARQALVDALRAAHPQTQLVGDVTRGHVEGFPMGELHFSPTELHWAMHGVDDPEPVHALADWFFDHGFACDDPQGAGFDRPRPKPVAVRGSASASIATTPPRSMPTSPFPMAATRGCGCCTSGAARSRSFRRS